MKAKFTPGPWEIEWGPNNKGIYKYWLERDLPFKEASANARLIAAAPEMYEALKIATKLLYEADALIEANTTHGYIAENIEALLAKIEGGE